MCTFSTDCPRCPVPGYARHELIFPEGVTIDEVRSVLDNLAETDLRDAMTADNAA